MWQDMESSKDIDPTYRKPWNSMNRNSVVDIKTPIDTSWRIPISPLATSPDDVIQKGGQVLTPLLSVSGWSRSCKDIANPFKEISIHQFVRCDKSFKNRSNRTSARGNRSQPRAAHKSYRLVRRRLEELRDLHPVRSSFHMDRSLDQHRHWQHRRLV